MTVTEMADLYLAKDWGALAEWTEVKTDATGTRVWWLPGVWTQIVDELDRRKEEAAQRRFDMAARAEGFRDAKHALTKMVDMPSAEVWAIYLRVFA